MVGQLNILWEFRQRSVSSNYIYIIIYAVYMIVWLYASILIDYYMLRIMNPLIKRYCSYYNKLLFIHKLLFNFEHNVNFNLLRAEKTVSLNQRNISLIYGERKNFFELKKVLLIHKNFLWSEEIDFFTLKTIFFNQIKFLQFKDIFYSTVYQRNCFLGARKKVIH